MLYRINESILSAAVTEEYELQVFEIKVLEGIAGPVGVVATALARIWRMLGSNPGRDTSYTD